MTRFEKRKEEEDEQLVVIDDESDFFYEDDEWEGCCEDPIELYEEDLLREDEHETEN